MEAHLKRIFRKLDIDESPDDPAQLERFAREVVPGVRENLAST